MAKEARDRYQTMAELEKALAAFEERPRGGKRQPQRGPRHAATGTAQRALAPREAALRRRRAAGRRRASAASRGPTIRSRAPSSACWLVGGMTAALAGLVRVLHEGEITLTECVLLVVGCLFAARRPWRCTCFTCGRSSGRTACGRSSSRAISKRTATAALVTYGGLRSSRASATPCSGEARRASRAVGGTSRSSS